jgi:hypothetical protein
MPTMSRRLQPRVEACGPLLLLLGLVADLLPQAHSQPTNPECTGIMGYRSRSGNPHGPWEGPTLLYNPSAPGHKKEWYSGYVRLTTPAGSSSA